MNEILSEGLAMMLIGMGTVLIFLCIMIICMFVMSWAVSKINKIFPEPVAQAAGGNAKKKSASADESEIAAAIAAAIFRRK